MRARWWAIVAVAPIAVLAHSLYLYSGMNDDLAWVRSVTGGDTDRAPRLMIANGCAGCHVIPGVPGATGTTGPSLGGYAQRGFIAGVLPNTSGNLIAWIRRSRDMAPKSAMPNTNVSEQDARDMAAFLYEPCNGFSALKQSCLERWWRTLRRDGKERG
ncbi:MAG: c-type cytochrome [Mesorhizobium sp.]|uniref:c-type cytochrome n=1 Tax=Mesorhizobium sp. TaxID=1871066 RepID=UPI000FE67965|nr:c-type cytochrome [Mesorhizobium sp.]RWM85291.1 MAG: c-type cytochrome [Mesorhizobium sp.]